MVTQGELDELWDFADARGSEERFRAAGFDPELRTQLARALGLQSRLDEAHAVLDAISDAAPASRTRVALERGRLLNASGDRAAAIPLFEEAAALAEASGLDFLAIDAHHMLAIVDPLNADAHTERALDLVAATDDDRTKRWEVSLHNNAGWRLLGAGDAAGALAEFEVALAAAEEFGTGDQRFWARTAVARALRETGRVSDALALLERFRLERPDDPDVADELAILRAL